jgi:hypothetical protein
VTVGADIPFVPMAHNIRPVIAKAAGSPGEYQARLTLEMYADCAVRLKIGGPLRDQLVEVRSFDEKGSGPPRRKAGAPQTEVAAQPLDASPPARVTVRDTELAQGSAWASPSGPGSNTHGWPAPENASAAQPVYK